MDKFILGLGHFNCPFSHKKTPLFKQEQIIFFKSKGQRGIRWIKMKA